MTTEPRDTKEVLPLAQLNSREQLIDWRVLQLSDGRLMMIGVVVHWDNGPAQRGYFREYFTKQYSL